VTGRLGVVGGQRTYNVTVAEIERRTRAPECVPLSLLGPLLKRGKVKGCGDRLKQLLANRQIPASGEGKSRKVTVSTLSALLEEEATQLSADHRELLFAYFPFVFLARLVVLQVNNPALLARADADAHAAMSIVSSLSSLLTSWNSSSNSPLSEYSQVTHTLG
ncbi:hypothetical protein PMAYCL1PPCAC_26058, partial [Pristionchus mayeri]